MAAKLGIADLLKDGPPVPADIAGVRKKFAARDETPPEEWAQRFTVTPPVKWRPTSE